MTGARVSTRAGKQRLSPSPDATRRRDFAWGFIGQGFSSATNFTLSLMAGRLLGPSGLGIVFIGFAAYQLVAALQRAVVTQPVIAHAAPSQAARRGLLIGSGFTAVLCTGVAASAVLGIAGALVVADAGRALLLFAPWLTVVVLQDYWKAVLFQEGRAGVAAATDVVRFALMAGGYFVALAWTRDFVIVGVWGFAGAAGLAVGVAALPVRMHGARAVLAAWRANLGILAGWLGAREVIFQAATYGTVLALSLIIGNTALGGLRSAEALFSPFSLIAAAFALPALPALSRALVGSRGAGVRLAARISVAALAAAGMYFVAMVFAGAWLLTHLFGPEFAPYKTLIWPMGLSQLALSATFAFTVLLIAGRRGRAAFAVGLVHSTALLLLTTTLGHEHGVLGAAWGMALTATAAGLAVVIAALREDFRGSTFARRIRLAHPDEG
jgi:O-antigen/teichoic acid export membrane protein